MSVMACQSNFYANEGDENEGDENVNEKEADEDEKSLTLPVKSKAREKMNLSVQRNALE